MRNQWAVVAMVAQSQLAGVVIATRTAAAEIAAAVRVVVVVASVDSDH